MRINQFVPVIGFISIILVAVIVVLFIARSMYQILDRLDSASRLMMDNSSGYSINEAGKKRIQRQINPASWHNSACLTLIGTPFLIMMVIVVDHAWLVTMPTIIIGIISAGLNIWYLLRLRQACQKFGDTQISERWQAFLQLYRSPLYLTSAVMQGLFAVITLFVITLPT